MSVPFLLAPMAEISHRALRELIESFGNGADEYYTEMISAGALVGGGPFEKWYTDPGPCPQKLVYQLVGADGEQLAKAASLLDKFECNDPRTGESGCLGIDINMGCAAPAITRTGAGVRWMEDMDKAGGMIALVRKQVKRRLSVKLRLGFVSRGGSEEAAFGYLVRFCRRLEAEGVELITLHPRSAKEKFKRFARWEYVSALRRELGIPVAGNGDIMSAKEMLVKSADCDAVMIGRLAVTKPWIFAEAHALRQNGKLALDSGQSTTPQADGLWPLHSESGKPPPAPGLPAPFCLEETGLRFLELLARYQPPEFHLSRARRF
ncbi:MAG: tRNA-dihydrouridine synthase family protein, partial [Treponema sp.]|nr:tRNA-dihydrouridine synthase family protein [Treponema sp.]